MLQTEEKLRCVSQQELKEVVKNGFSYVRISFQNEMDPIYLVYKEKPTAQDISDFVYNSLRIFYDGELILTWSQNKSVK